MPQSVHHIQTESTLCPAPLISLPLSVSHLVIPLLIPFPVYVFPLGRHLSYLHQTLHHGEINRYRGLSDLQDTLEKLMRDTQGRVMEVMKELVVVESQLNLCKKRLEISNSYEELDRYFRQAMPVPLHPFHSPIHSPLVEAPRVVRAVMPLPSCARGAVEMPILHSNDLDHRWVVQCFRCKKVGHVVSQCPRKKKNCRCTMCGGTHKVAKCPINSNTTSLEVVVDEQQQARIIYSHQKCV